jgi:magnesium transporter
MAKAKCGDFKITALQYSENFFEEKNVASLDEIVLIEQSDQILWVNVNGIHHGDAIEKIAAKFNLHPLVLEDILDVSQRPKFVEHSKYMYVILKTAIWQEEQLRPEQVSLVIGSNYIITFQEGIQDNFTLLREAILAGKGRIRKQGIGYLIYAIIDKLVENYFVVMENFGESVELLEERLLIDSKTVLLPEIHFLKTEMLLMRKLVWPMREVIAALTREQNGIFNESSLIYMRDIYDHTVQIMDTVEMYRDIISGMLELYLTSISNHLSEVMKVLTVISTIFIPLTFIVGLYGMNFKYMPELEWEWGYPVILCVMAVISISMICYFKQKKWL